MWDHIIYCWELSIAPHGLGKGTPNNSCSSTARKLCGTPPPQGPHVSPMSLPYSHAGLLLLLCFPSGACTSSILLNGWFFLGLLAQVAPFPQSDVTLVSPTQRSLPWPPSFIQHPPSTPVLFYYITLLIQRTWHNLNEFIHFFVCLSPRACLSCLLWCP